LIPRYAVNWRLLLVSLCAAAVGLPAAYAWYRHQLRQTSHTLLVRAESLRQAGDLSQAAAYYQRYLLLQPADTRALIQLVETVAEGEPTPDRLNRVTNLLYRTVGRVPERSDLRRMLAENLLRLGAYEEAKREADLLLKNAPTEARAARRVQAISLAALARQQRGNSLAEAGKALIAAAAETPGDTELVETAANLLREFPEAIEPTDNSSATVADQLMDRLVAADPENVATRIARFRYRTKYLLPNPNVDLEAALELEPNNLEALLLSAVSAIAGTPSDAELANAKAVLRRAIDLAPQDPRAYLVIAGILEKSAEHGEALAYLQQARDATKDDFQVGLAYANSQITAGKLPEARQTVQELESQLSTELVRLDGEARRQTENRLRLLRARLELAQNNSRSATTLLEAVLIAAEAAPGYQRIPEWLQATRVLAQLHGRRGDWDKASEYWGRLAAALPADATVVGQAADAYLKAANAEPAVLALDELKRLVGPNRDLLVRLTQAHLALQLNRPNAVRNWTEFERALKAAKLAAPDQEELLFAEVNYLVAKADHPSALALLRSAETQFSENGKFWQDVARVYQELGQDEDMRRALDKYREFATSPTEHAVFQAALLARSGDSQLASELLDNVNSPISAEDRKTLERARIESMVASNKLVDALKYIERLVNSPSRDSDSLSMGIEIALAAGEVQTAQKWESLLLESAGDGGRFQYWRARRLLKVYETLSRPAKQELGRAIAAIRKERPKWYPAVALSATYEKLQGDSRQSLADFELAVELGDRRPATIQQFVTLLYEYGRFEEAQGFLSLLSNDSSSPFLETMAIELAVQLHDTSQALALAQKSTERFPEDAIRRITYANLLIECGKRQEGLDVLRQATRRFANDTRVWLALFSALVKSGATDEARDTLAILDANSELSPSFRYFVTAQGYDALGDAEAAKKFYALAIEQDPGDLTIRLKFAKLLSLSDPTAARAQYEHVLQQDPKNGDARRELAILLAATKQDVDWERANTLLASVSRESAQDARTNDRLRAMLLSQKGRTRAERISNCRTARDILQHLIETEHEEGNDLNRVLMAQILEQEAELSDDPTFLYAARDELRAVVNRAPPTVEKLSLYIEFLLRNAAVQELDAHRKPDTADSTFQADRQDVFLSEAELRIGELRQLQANREAGLESLAVFFQARLLHAQGREADAKEHVAAFVAQQTAGNRVKFDQAQQQLTVGRMYSSIGEHAEADKWYRRVMELTTNGYVLVVQSLLAQEKREEAIDLCLSVAGGRPSPEMATLLVKLMTATDQPVAAAPKAQAAIDAAVEIYGDNIPLLQAEAVRRASQGSQEGAIAVLRRILELDPANVLTLNNLATVLAEKPNQRAEALALIQKAIDVAGRQPALLDTLGTIYLKIGDVERAIVCLEEATAGGAADARYYLHLAAAYHQAQRDEDAIRMFIESRGFGLEKFVLTGDDRQMITKLVEQYNSRDPQVRL
jgi:tetratricopeptide (TPR) repeat protein